MNKNQLVKEVAKATKLTQKSVEDVINITMDVIIRSVSKGKKITLSGFGTFESRKRAHRVGRNPQTGKKMDIPAKTVPVFTAGKNFKDVVKS